MIQSISYAGKRLQPIPIYIWCAVIHCLLALNTTEQSLGNEKHTNDMKLHSKHLFIGTALLAFLFSGCDKNEQIEQQGPIIKDGKILLTAGYNAPRSDSKYTFNVFYNVCFFDNEDSVYVNGNPFAVFPYNGGGDDETDTASSWAHIWVDTNSTGIYKGLYPKSAFTSSIANYETPTVFIPRRVQAIDYNEYTVSSNVHINAPVDGRIIPTTAYTTASSIEDSLIFHNTIAMLAIKLRYHRDFAKAIDPSATAATGCHDRPYAD